MSEIEIKQMQEKINAGILLARRLFCFLPIYNRNYLTDSYL